jgi:hypothetical protein
VYSGFVAQSATANAVLALCAALTRALACSTSGANTQARVLRCVSAVEDELLMHTTIPFKYEGQKDESGHCHRSHPRHQQHPAPTTPTSPCLTPWPRPKRRNTPAPPPTTNPFQSCRPRRWKGVGGCNSIIVTTCVRHSFILHQRRSNPLSPTARTQPLTHQPPRTF